MARLYTNHDCILVKGAEAGVLGFSHLKHAGQGAKTKINHELNISFPHEGAERGEMLVSAPIGAVTLSSLPKQYTEHPRMYCSLFPSRM